MQIGRFSRLTGLTVKALRHYDELGLLRPSAVDPDTGYRMYTAEQVERAELLRQTAQALYHAQRWLDSVEANEDASMEDWDLAGGYEALARAHLTAGDEAEARRYAELGRGATARIADADDRKVFEADFATID